MYVHSIYVDIHIYIQVLSNIHMYLDTISIMKPIKKLSETNKYNIQRQTFG